MEIIVILHNIRSAHNVGSIFRTADGAGVSKIYLTGHTPAPIDRFGRTQPEIQKTSLGAAETVSWEYREDILALIVALKNDGNTIVAVEQHEKARSYDELLVSGSIVYIFGNEVDGVPDSVLVEATEIAEIPMHGKKESLNVAVAAGIILFSTRQRQ